MSCIYYALMGIVKDLQTTARELRNSLVFEPNRAFVELNKQIPGAVQHSIVELFVIQVL